MNYETTVIADATIDQAWDALVRVEQWPKWTKSITKVEWQDGAALALGSRATVKQPGMPSLVWEVCELEPGESFAWRASSTGVTTVGNHSLRPIDQGRVEITLTLRQSGPLSSIIGMLTARKSRRYMNMEAEGLKRCAEGA